MIPATLQHTDRFGLATRYEELPSVLVEGSWLPHWVARVYQDVLVAQPG